jgi:uncharacterized protein (DUF3084 family)
MAEVSSTDVRVATTDKLLFGVVSAVTVALLLWVGTTLNSSQVQIGKLQVEVMQLRDEIRQATSDSREVNRRLRDLERDVATLKNGSRGL